MRQREDLEKLSLKILHESEAELYLAFRYMAPALSSMPFVFDTSTRRLGTDSESFFYNSHFLMQTYLQHPYMVNRAYMHLILHCIFRHVHEAEAHVEAERPVTLSELEKAKRQDETDPLENQQNRFIPEQTTRAAVKAFDFNEQSAGDFHAVASEEAAYLFDLHEPRGNSYDKNHELWDLACDIAVEHILDGMDADAVRRTPDSIREECYTRLENEVRILTAERLFQYFVEVRNKGGLPYDLLMKMTTEFLVDDHSFWYRDRKKQHADEKRRNLTPEQMKQKEEEWKKKAKQVRENMDAEGKKGSSAAGGLDQMLTFSVRRRRTYHELLRHFAVEREECRIDPDSFDYGYYCFGLEHYGNMPLIEENEYTDSRKVRDFVIAIDTSASVADGQMARFLKETADVLLGGNLYFKKGRIHILLADTQVRSDTVLTSAEEMKDYASGFHIQGGGGTDFRPVFTYVEKLLNQGDMRDLKGLIYFTDGLGTYPKTPTPYETAFVFSRDDLVAEKEIPPWVVPIFLKEESKS